MQPAAESCSLWWRRRAGFDRSGFRRSQISRAHPASQMRSVVEFIHVCKHVKRLFKGSPSLVYSAIGGVMTGVAFPPTGFWPLAWGAMIPLFLVIASAPRERAFTQGLAFFLPAFGIPYYWVALHRMTTPALVSIVALLAVMVSAAAMIALFAGSGRRSRPAARIIAAACSLLLC